MLSYLRCAPDECPNWSYFAKRQPQNAQNQLPPKRERLKNTQTKNLPFPLICYLRDRPSTDRKRLRNPKVDN